ncbi:MAG TPA: hypothetical protein VK151_11500 [Fluviicola sp.]|nr:hypothetical protein [Fluviicola sp.]
MEFISLVFRLGVVLAIFSFIWGLLRLGLTILRGGAPLSYPVGLSLKMVQYFLIADITILFCETKSDSLQLDLVLSGLILLMYFIGKVQNMKTKLQFITIQTRGLNEVHKPNMNLEFGVIALSMALFVFLAIKQEYAVNPASTWFYKTITDIEKTPIFGFIFQVIGFFFTINMLLKMFGAVTLLLSGKAFNKPNDKNRNDNGDDNPYHFDDYEEIK